MSGTGLEFQARTPCKGGKYNPERLGKMTAEERETEGIDSLPGTLEEAISYMKENELVKEALGAHTFEKYIEAKEAEWDEYKSKVHDWEIEKYLKKY